MTKEIIVYIFIFLACLYILGLMRNISLFFKEKRNYQFMINQREKDSKSHINILDKVDATVGIINLCNLLIDNEVSKTMQACIRLNTKYDVTRLDHDVRIMATTVFESIRAEVFESPDLIITDKFLMQHITDEVMLKLMTAGQEWNTRLKQN